MKICGYLSCFPGQSGLWVPREWLLELGSVSLERKVRIRRPVGATGDGAWTKGDLDDGLLQW